MREPFKRDASESVPCVTINGEQIDAGDQHAIDEAFTKIAWQRDRVVASYAKHLHRARGRT